MILTPELEEVGKRTRILRDRVLVKVLPYVHPVLITPGIEIQKGVVVGVGYGRRQRRKVGFQQNMPGQAQGKTIYFEDGDETGKILLMQVQPGDVVEFSFRNMEIVDFDRLSEFYNLNVGQLAFVWQKAIYYIDPDESLSDALMWQKSAGYDRHGNFMSGAEDWHRAN